MVAKRSLQAQLRRLKLRFLILGRGEVKELQRILRPGEFIHHCVYGFYQGGSGLLVATDDRLLLIDKRPFFVNLEEFSYEQLRDVDFAQRLLQGTLYLQAGLRKLTFRSISDARLKKAKLYIEQVIEQSKHEDITDTPTIKAFVVASGAIQPYLNPAWRPRHTTLARQRPSKFYRQPSPQQ